jgi:PAS domain S-box-containing protein
VVFVEQCVSTKDRIRGDSDQEYHRLFATIDHGFCIIEVLFDENGRPFDYRFLETNPAFENHTGLHAAEGRTIRDFVPNHEKHWYEIYGRVAVTGEPVRFVNEAKAMGRWYDVHASRFGGPDSRKVAVLFTDITQRTLGETQLARLSQQRQVALDAANLGWWHYDPATRQVSYDVRYREIFGVTGSEQPNDAILKLLHPDDLPRVWAVVEAALNPLDPQPFSAEYRINRLDGLTCWVEAHGLASFEGEGRKRRAVSFVGTVADVTERKRVASELIQLAEESARQQRMYETALSNTVDFNYLFDLHGRFSYVNKALLDLWQKDLSQAIGKDFFDLDYPAELAARLQRQIQEVIQYKQPIRDETPYTSAIGTRAYEYIFAPVLGADGSVEAVAGSTRDITERKFAEAERERLLKEVDAERERLAEVFRQAPSFMCILSGPDHVFERANDRYYELVGHRDILGKPAREALPEVEGQGFFELLDNVYRTGEPYVGLDRSVLLQREPDRPPEERFLDLVYQPVRGADGAILGIFAQGIDVTERRLAEQELRQASLRKDEFLATLAHELRNPLAPIRLGLAVLQTEKLTGNAGTVIAMMDRQLTQLVRLVDDLLDVSRVTTGKITLRPETIDVRDVIAAAIETSRPSIDSAHHQFEVSLPEESLLLRADRTRLIQIITNIINNACKYTPDGGRIALSAERKDDAVLIRVQDSGIGLPADMLSQVFETFTQVGRSIDRAQGGLGLGLALVRRLTEMHGGKVWAESPGSGEGSTFTLWLPLRPQNLLHAE